VHNSLTLHSENRFPSLKIYIIPKGPYSLKVYHCSFTCPQQSAAETFPKQLLLRGRDTSVQLHPWKELYSGEHHENEKPGSFIPSVRVPVQQERHLRRCPFVSWAKDS
jgi:hypothetical protein